MKIFKKALVFISMTMGMTLGLTQIQSNTTTAHASSRFSKIKKVANRQLGKSYQWGAVGPRTFDCSGFTGYTYKKAINKVIPRTAQQQYNSQKHVSYHHAKPGDLVFFGSNKVNIEHVGLYVGKGKMIDAQNRGVITENVIAPWWHLVGTARVR